jgi:hypothetical protein
MSHGASWDRNTSHYISAELAPSTRRMSHERRLWAGTGACQVAGCGCGGYVAPQGGSTTYCIGKNAANGTCGHGQSQHA